MDTRGTVIAAIVVAEFAIVGFAVAAVRGVEVPLSFAPRYETRAPSDGRLVEDGPHATFEMGAHPTLTVNIGYADLTIRPAKTAIDASVNASSTLGILNATAPILARRDGDSVTIATAVQGWSTGDDRMLTVLVPPQTEVTVIRAGDIKANGLRAEASFKSVGEGSIAIEDYDGPALSVESAGRISLRRVVASRLDAESSDDRIEGSGLQVRDGAIESDDRLTLGFTPATDTLITAEARNGRISVSGFGAAASAASVVKSGDDGDDSSSRTVRLGSGRGNLEVRSSDGNIVLAQDS
jgi:hypothetical protein